MGVEGGGFPANRSHKGASVDRGHERCGNPASAQGQNGPGSSVMILPTFQLFRKQEHNRGKNGSMGWK